MIHQTISFMATCCVAICITGCAANKANLVEKRMILPPFAMTMELENQQSFLMAAPIDEPMPLFPENMHKQNGRAEVCIEIVVQEDGTVGESMHMPGTDTCDVRPDETYVEAALEAVRRWTFFAAAVCEFPDNIMKTDDCSGDGVVVRAVPIKLMYAFEFESRGGKGRVGSRRIAD